MAGITLLTSRKLDNSKYRVMLCDEDMDQIIRADVSGIDDSFKPNMRVYRDKDTGEFIFTHDSSDSPYNLVEKAYGNFEFGPLARGVTYKGICKYLGGMSELIDEYGRSNHLSVLNAFKRG